MDRRPPCIRNDFSGKCQGRTNMPFSLEIGRTRGQSSNRLVAGRMPK
jgi:hypothetical protein